MAECIVCGEKIEDGKQYCSVCAPENHNKLESTENANTEIVNDNQSQIQENKVEIKKNSAVIDDENADDDNSLEANKAENE